MAKQPKQVKPEEIVSIARQEEDRFKNEYVGEFVQEPETKLPKLTISAEDNEALKESLRVNVEEIKKLVPELPFEVMDFPKEVIKEMGGKPISVVSEVEEIPGLEVQPLPVSTLDKSSRGTFYMGRGPSRR